MTESKKCATGLVNSTEKLRNLLIEHPDLPLVVFANSDANAGDFSLMSCYFVNAEVGEFLDCWQAVNDERCYTEREDFEQDIYDSICFDFEGSDQDLEQEVKRKMKEYDAYWKPCIILIVGN